MTEKYTLPATLLCDFYKVSHLRQYPKGTEFIYSTFTPRTSRLDGINGVVAFGLQGFIKKFLINYFNENFFGRPKEDVINEYTRVLKYTLGVENPDATHIGELYDLGYLPVKIKSLKEGTLVPIKVPMVTVENTLPEFFWVTNYLETLMSAELWQATTSATIAYEYRKMLEKYAKETGGDMGFVPFQGHDFSMRGMSSLESARLSGAGHLLSFVGTDTIPAILYLEEFYNANIEKELVGTSIPATEHSISCSYGSDNEFEYYTRLINEVYPNGFVSLVSDTYDFWKVIEEYIPKLKNEIMNRDGKVVIRPDSGDPVEIVCGHEILDLTNEKYCDTLEDCKDYMKDMLVEKVGEETPHGEHGDWEVEGKFKFNEKYYKVEIQIDWNRYDKQYYYIDGSKITKFEKFMPTVEELGLIESLWNIFGGTVNEKGYKVLDSHIGAIYGDSITLERAKAICEGLRQKGFASTNIVFGIGSFTFQYNTRDTFGFAMKATHAVVNGEERMLFKDPKTDNGTKKSQRGRVAVLDAPTGIVLQDGLNIAEDKWIKPSNLLEDVFIDGKLERDESLSEIRERLLNNI